MEGFGGCLEPDMGVNVQGSGRNDGGFWDGCRDKGGLVAATMAGLFCTSSEEDFGRATNEEMEVGAATMAGFKEAAISLMRASTGLEVAAVMAGLVGAAAAIADSRQCCNCGG